MLVLNRYMLSRRDFLAATGAAPLAGAVHPAPAGVHVIDAHCHLQHPSRASARADDRKLIDAADKLGIDQLCCSILPPERPATADSFRECNQWTYEAIRRFPGRILGYCFVNPGYTREALAEVRRCLLLEGFIGIKLYNDYRADEPVVFPIAELAIELGVPILQHAGHASWLPQPQPRISDAGHLAALSRRYPEAMLICAHISGGGDWEWAIKALQDAPGVYLDTSGSVTDEGVLEMAVRYLGADRLLFATDLSLTAGVGRIRGAEIPEADRARILGANMLRILDRRRKA